MPGSEQPPATVFLRPIGAPLALGMGGLAIASVVTSGHGLGWIAHSQAVEVGIVLVSVPFLVQVIAAVLSYLARDGAGGAAIGVLATTWLAYGVMRIVQHGAKSGALGLLLLCSAGVLCLSATAASTRKPLPAAVFCLSAARFAVEGIYELGAGKGCLHAADVIGLVVAATAAYCMLAFGLEDAMHRPVLPTFRRGAGCNATGHARIAP